MILALFLVELKTALLLSQFFLNGVAVAYTLGHRSKLLNLEQNFIVSNRYFRKRVHVRKYRRR